MQEEGVEETRARTDRSDTETAAGEEVASSQSRYKKGHMTNIYLTDSDKEAIVNFVNDHEELYDKTNEHFKDKARKECLREVRQQSQVVCQDVEDPVRVVEDTL